MKPLAIPEGREKPTIKNTIQSEAEEQEGFNEGSESEEDGLFINNIGIKFNLFITSLTLKKIETRLDMVFKVISPHAAFLFFSEPEML